MNTNILKKCVEELKKESPKIDYVLGMLESVIELSAIPPSNFTVATPSFNTITIPTGTPMATENGSGLDTSIPESYVTKPGPIASLK